MKRALHAVKKALYAVKRALYAVKSTLSTRAHRENMVYLQVWMQSKEPYIQSKEPCIQSKEPSVHKKSPICYIQPNTSPVYYEKSPISREKNPISREKNPISREKNNIYAVKRALYGVDREPCTLQKEARMPWILSTCALFNIGSWKFEVHFRSQLKSFETYALANESGNFPDSKNREWCSLFPWCALFLGFEQKPCTLWKEPCVPWKEPYFPWKEPYPRVHIAETWFTGRRGCNQKRLICYGVATTSRLLKMIGLFCKRAL